MNDKFLHRDDVPFGPQVWEKIDAAVIGVARSRLSARRLLETEGPYGYSLQSIASSGSHVVEDEKEATSLRISHYAPVPEIESAFSLAIRDIAIFEETGHPLDLGPAVKASAAVADREDALLFYGSDKLGLKGLVNSNGVQSVSLGSWDAVGAAVDNVLQAAGKLDSAGFHGPYALALPPNLYNLLFRLFPQTSRSELEQLRQAVTGGIVKAPVLQKGGVLVTSIREIASIVIGRDLETSFVGPSGRLYDFAVSESVALQLREPSSVCVLK